MADPNVIKLAYELSASRLNSQQTAALAADARAMSFAATMVAAAAILAGLSKDANNPIAMLIGSLVLILAAAVAGYSARPIKFYMPGARFSDLSEDISSAASLDNVLSELGGHNDANSDENDKKLANNSKLMKLAFVFAIIGVLVATVPQIFLSNEKPTAAEEENALVTVETPDTPAENPTPIE